MIAPNMTNPTMNPTPDAVLKVRLRNRSRDDRFGHSRFDDARRPEIKTAPSTASPMMGAEPQRYCSSAPTWSSNDTVTPAESSDVPAQSILCRARAGGQVQHRPQWRTAPECRTAR